MFSRKEFIQTVKFQLGQTIQTTFFKKPVLDRGGSECNFYRDILRKYSDNNICQKNRDIKKRLLTNIFFKVSCLYIFYTMDLLHTSEVVT